MPDPIQPVPGLCTSVQTLDNYRRQINLSLQLTLDAINEELGTTFSLPGLPPLPVQGLPELVVPGRAGWDRDLQIRKPVPPAGFIGNRFGIRAGGKSVEAKLRIGELPGFSIGGTGGLVVGGTDPSTFLITWINTNYQILAEQLAGESIEWTPIQVPYTELCETGAGEQDGGGSVSPGQLLVNDIVLLNNQGAILVGVAVCTPYSTLTPFTDSSCWDEAEVGGSGSSLVFSTARGASSLTIDVAGTYYEEVFDSATTSLGRGLSRGGVSNVHSTPSSVNPNLTTLYKGTPCQLIRCEIGAAGVWTITFDWEMELNHGGASTDRWVDLGFNATVYSYSANPDNSFNSTTVDILNHTILIAAPTLANGTASGTASKTIGNGFASSGQTTAEAPATGFFVSYSVGARFALHRTNINTNPPYNLEIDWNGNAELRITNFLLTIS